jgi:hypothetical protein
MQTIIVELNSSWNRKKYFKWSNLWKTKFVIVKKGRKGKLIIYAIVLINSHKDIYPIVRSSYWSFKAVEYQQEISWNMAPFKDDIYDFVIK